MPSETYQLGGIGPVVEAVYEELNETFPLCEDDFTDDWMGSLANRIARLLNPEPDSDDPRQWTIRLRRGLERY